MPRNSAARSPKSSPNCSARPRAPRPPPVVGRASCTREMRDLVSRRRFLKYSAAGLSVSAVPGLVRAQTAVQPPPKPAIPDEFSVTAPVSIEVNARPLPSFDTRDRSHVRFDFAKGFTRALGEVMPLPPAARKLPFNKGLEALVMVPKGFALAGTLLAISERGLDAQGNILAFLIGGKTPGQFTVRRTDNFDISDAVLLPSGDLLLLERKFSLLGGIGIRIRRIALASVAPGAVIDGPAIFNADLGNEIDNMEGIDAHVTPEGETVLTLVSDDNFSMIQRNLLLQFTLGE